MTDPGLTEDLEDIITKLKLKLQEKDEQIHFLKIKNKKKNKEIKLLKTEIKNLKDPT